MEVDPNVVIADLCQTIAQLHLELAKLKAYIVSQQGTTGPDTDG